MSKPALTAEEWADYETDYRGHFGGPRDRYTAVGEHARGAIDGQEDYHAAAALCLHEQPYGFTREDVALLRVKGWANEDEYPQTASKFQALADRIEALLPPEDG